MFFLGLFVALFVNVQAQDAAVQNAPKPISELAKPYDESLDAMAQIADAVAKAKAEGKTVMCQVGGNWCKWCLWFADFITKDEDIKAAIDKDFVYVHVNYSPKNKNEKALEFFGNPHYGYPYFVVINSDGRVVAVQESISLEEGEGYSKERVLAFFSTYAAMNVADAKQSCECCKKCKKCASQGCGKAGGEVGKCCQQEKQ
ncbi:MAG: thioredoxin family protein [Fibrobacter sp.]|nr:thioredoxin family protein [Fibrobacter sp.]